VRSEAYHAFNGPAGTGLLLASTGGAAVNLVLLGRTGSCDAQSRYENKFRDLFLFILIHQFLSGTCQVSFFGFAGSFSFPRSVPNSHSHLTVAGIFYLLTWV